MRLATGTAFASREVKQIPVLYLDRENPAAVVRLRRDILRVGDPPLLRYWGQWMTDPPCLPGDERLIEFARAHRPLIVFDSLVRFHRGEENSAEQMAMVTNLFRNLVAVGATVLVIAHRSDKPGASDYRGSSELLAGCDVAWRVGRREQDRRAIDLHCLKNRFAEESDFALRLEEGGFIPELRQSYQTPADAFNRGARRQ